MRSRLLLPAALPAVLALVVAAAGASCAPRRSASPDVAAASPASAALPRELAGARRVHALLVSGDAEARHRKNVAEAARALAARGVAPAQITTLDAGARPGSANRRAFEAAVDRLVKDVGPDDAWVLYVTGHGTADGIALEGDVLPHEDLVRRLAPLARRRAVIVFDGCHTGGLPWRFVEAGFAAHAMAPVAEGRDSHCHLFAPHLWDALARGLDTDGDGLPSFREAFRFALGVYDAHLREARAAPAGGAFASPIRELTAWEELASGAALVQITSRSCAPCAVQKKRLALFSALVDDVRVYTIDAEENRLARSLPDVGGKKAWSGSVPTLLLVKGGRIVARHEGLTANTVLLAEAHEKLGARRAEHATSEALVRSLGAADDDRAGFAMRALVELGDLRPEVVATMRRWLRDPRAHGDAVAAFVDATRHTAGFAALKAELGDEGRRDLVRALAMGQEQRVRAATERLQGTDPTARATAFMDMWRLASAPDTDLGVLARTLGPLRDLAALGDEEQRRIAGRLVEDITARFRDVRIAVWVEGADAVLTTAVEKAFAGLDLGTITMLGKPLVESVLAESGYLASRASRAAFDYDDGTVRIGFAVDRGVRYRLREMRAVELARDDSTLPEVAPLGGAAALHALESLPRGEVVKRSALLERTSAAERRYRSAGYAEARATPDLDLHDDGTCTITLRVVRGPLRSFGDVAVTGASPPMLARARAAIGIAHGQRYDEGRLEAAKARVTALPGIARVDVSTKIGKDGLVHVSFELRPKP